MVETEGKVVDFGRSRSMENLFLSVLFASVGHSFEISNSYLVLSLHRTKST